MSNSLGIWQATRASAKKALKSDLGFPAHLPSRAAERRAEVTCSSPPVPNVRSGAAASTQGGHWASSTSELEEQLQGTGWPLPKAGELGGPQAGHVPTPCPQPRSASSGATHGWAAHAVCVAVPPSPLETVIAPKCNPLQLLAQPHAEPDLQNNSIFQDFNTSQARFSSQAPAWGKKGSKSRHEMHKPVRALGNAEWDLFKPASATQGLDLPAGLLKLGRTTHPCSSIKWLLVALHGASDNCHSDVVLWSSFVSEETLKARNYQCKASSPGASQQVQTEGISLKLWAAHKYNYPNSNLSPKRANPFSNRH